MADKHSKPFRQRRVRLVIAVLGVALVAFSTWSLFVYVQGDSTAWLKNQPILQTTQESQGNTNGGKDNTPERLQDGNISLNAIDSGSAENGGGDTASSPSDSEPSGSHNVVDGSDNSTTGSGQSDGVASAADTQTQHEGQTQDSEPEQSQNISVSVAVDGSSAGGSSHSAAIELERGANVYDALVAMDSSVSARASVYGMYVASIDGIAEKEHGSASGWLYSVNGVRPDTACSNYKLSDGDVIVWSYWVGDELPS